MKKVFIILLGMFLVEISFAQIIGGHIIACDTVTKIQLVKSGILKQCIVSKTYVANDSVVPLWGDSLRFKLASKHLDMLLKMTIGDSLLVEEGKYVKTFVGNWYFWKYNVEKKDVWILFGKEGYRMYVSLHSRSHIPWIKMITYLLVILVFLWYIYRFILYGCYIYHRLNFAILVILHIATFIYGIISIPVPELKILFLFVWFIFGFISFYFAYTHFGPNIRYLYSSDGIKKIIRIGGPKFFRPDCIIYVNRNDEKFYRLFTKIDYFYFYSYGYDPLERVINFDNPMTGKKIFYSFKKMEII